MGVGDVFRTDLTLIHPPSVFDFREQTIVRGPVADAIPSTEQFEMYPAGITSIASYLGKNQYNVRVLNLAYRMLKDPSFDVEKRIMQLRSTIFGIDLHWLPHANGALGIAELTKRIHPESFILLGGLSASYYYEELIRYPFIDFVIRGDSTEEPCRQLLVAARGARPMGTVENLVWKKPDDEIVINPLTFIPTSLDYVDVPDYRYAIKSAFKYHSVADLVPYLRWLGHPTGMILNSRGCTLNCSTCGGSRSSYRQICERTSPAFRSPERLVHDIKSFHAFSNGPILMVHDPRVGGLNRAKRFFSLLKDEGVPNEMVFELFYPAGDDLFQLIQESVQNWSLELTIETPSEKLRRLDTLKFPVSNSKIEDTIARALSHNCRRLDLFFMVGIPHQTYEDVMDTVPYCEELINRFCADARLQFFIAPMGPFLDPASGAFEDPRFGYKHFCRTLEEHRQALLQSTWRSILSYETDAMSRDQILEASYDVAAGINELKFRYGLIDPATYEHVKSHQLAAKTVISEIDQAMRLPESEKRVVLVRIQERVRAASVDSLFSKKELDWGAGEGFRLGATLFGTAAVGLAEEVVHGFNRLIGRYDTCVYDGSRAIPHSEAMKAPDIASQEAQQVALLASSSTLNGRV